MNNKIFLVTITKFTASIAKNPLIFLATSYSINFAWVFFANKYNLDNKLRVDLAFYFINIAQVVAVYWTLHNLLHEGPKSLIAFAYEKHYTLLLIVIPPILSSLEAILFLVMVNTLLFSLQLEGGMGVFVENGSKVLLILTIAWVFYKIICGIEQYLTTKYITENEDISASRKIHTQIAILKRLVGFFIGVITFAAIIMVFDSLRSIGTSVLTTAGFISAIGAFASQQSLGRIFAGLQLAFTQPIRIGDTVIIENEFGQVEEITLSFITIKLWDLRRLILPTDHFIQKGVLNLTRESSELLGTVLLYADYTLPVDEIRQKFIELLDASPLWNKKVVALEITGFKEKTMEIRCLMSADNATNLWKLRCDIREKLISYIVKNHYDCLSKSRTVQVPPKLDTEAIAGK